MLPNVFRILPPRVWLLIATIAVLAGGVAYAHRLRSEIASLKRENAVLEANARARLDSTRVVYESELERLEARLVVFTELTERQQQELARIPGLERALRESRREPVGVVRREIRVDSLEATSSAPVAVDTADVREAFFEESVPGGRLTAHVRLGPDTGWARLRASINPCELTDVLTADNVSVELYQYVEGRCVVHVLDTPTLTTSIVTPSTPRPSLLSDGRLWGGLAVGAVATALLAALM